MVRLQSEAEVLQRLATVIEARSWIGTPYHPGGRVKGAGCDCGSCLYCILVNSRAIEPDAELEEFFAHVSVDAWAHWTEEQYLFRMRRHAAELMRCVAAAGTELLPGNLILCKAFGANFYNHGGIVTDWPKIVHCFRPCVAETSALWHPAWANREIIVFDPFAGRPGC